jgi:hypothetical protein
MILSSFISNSRDKCCACILIVRISLVSRCCASAQILVSFPTSHALLLLAVSGYGSLPKSILSMSPPKGVSRSNS